MPGFNGVSIDVASVKLPVDRVQIEPMPAGNERKGRIEIFAKFLRIASFAGMGTGDRNAAAQGRIA